MGSALRFVYAGIAVMLLAVIMSSAAAVFIAQAQTVPTIEFTNEAGDPINSVNLPANESVTVQIRVSNLESTAINTAIVGIVHDTSQIVINSYQCDGIMKEVQPTATPTPPTPVPTPATPTPTPSPVPAFTQRNYIAEEGYSWIFCGLPQGTIGATDGLIMTLTLFRTGAGDATLQFVTSGVFATQMYEPGIEHPFDQLIPLQVTQTSPTPIATATSTGGGGGGGGLLPTATSSAPLFQVPGVPRNVVVSPIVEGFLVSWDAPLVNGGTAITQYRVLVAPTGKTMFVPGEARQAVITGLDPDEEYQVQVNAVNDIGSGQAAPLSAPMSPVRPLSEPLNVSASLAPDGVSAIVSWEPPEFPGLGPVTSYVITAQPSTGSGLEVGPDELSVIVSGLEQATLYTFYVRAWNDDVLGPLSDPSNEILTAVFSGAPGDSIGQSVTTGISAPQSELDSFGQAASAALGSNITISGPAMPVTSDAGGLLVTFPAQVFGTVGRQVNTLQTRIGNLSVDIVDGAGTATLMVDANTTITGAARVDAASGALQVHIDAPSLSFTPPAPVSFSGGGGLVTFASAEFGVGLTDLPERMLLSAQYYGDVRQVPGGFAAFQLAAVGSGGVIETPETDIAFVVVVSKQDITNDELGDNTVTLTASRAWYDSQTSNGKSIFITKVGDNGLIHTAPADCELAALQARCTVTFTGLAGGFSIFGLTALEVDESLVPTRTPEPNATSTPAASPTAAPTSTPVPSPQPRATATPNPTVTPTPGTQASPTPTSTALANVAPTAGSATASPEIAEPSDRRFPWAPLLITVGVLAVLAPAVGAGYRLWRRQSTRG